MALLRELKELHHTYKTIQRYLAPDCLVVNGHYNNRIPGKLAPYEKEVIELRSQGMTYPAIHRIISKKGYKGSVASLRMFIQKEKIRNQEIYNYNNIRSGYEPKEYIQRKSLSQLIYKSINDIHTIEADQFEQVLKTYPVLAPLYGSIRRFYEIIYSKQDGMIDGWLKELGQVEIPELETYIKGKKKDKDAVKNGIRYSYNNGIAEGSVNKIKVIKRVMYGRNSFDLLKAKVLFYEQFRFTIN